MDKRLRFIIACAAVLLAASQVSAAPGSGWGYSFHGVYYPYSFYHDVEMDSGSVQFAYPDTTNYYDTITITPSDLDSTVMTYDSLYLDSLGDHRTVTIYYERGSTTPDTSFGVWFHGAAWSKPGVVGGIPTGAQTCAVSIVLLESSGDPAAGVWVTCYLARGNLVDSAGYGVTNKPQRKKTSAIGVVTFNCRWSSYLIPATDWIFICRSPAVGGIKRVVTVPREVSTTLNLNSF